MQATFSSQENQSLEEIQKSYQTLKKELKKKIVGQEEIIDRCLIAIFSGGHCLLVGVPGLAKTLLVSTLASLLSMKFNRIQFTPDLMPSDIIGTQIITEDSAVSEKKGFKFIRGPIFANLILADEINRTPPKTQAALIEAMEEIQVSIGGEELELPRPFFVMATQNPIEQEGTYPLPYAQLDRFMFRLDVEYPTEEEEYEILDLTTSAYEASLSPVLKPSQILDYIQMVQKVQIDDELIRYAIRLTRATRPSDPTAPDFINQWVECGASPRGAKYIITASKAWALLNGRPEVSVRDVRYVALSVLEHRLILSYHAQVEKLSPADLLRKIFDTVPAPREKGWNFFPFNLFSTKKSSYEF